MKKILLALLGFLFSYCLYGQVSLTKPVSVTELIEGNPVTGLKLGKFTLFLRESAVLETVWEDLVNGLSEYGQAELPELTIFWGWSKPKDAEGVFLDYLPFRETKPLEKSKFVIYISIEINGFKHYLPSADVTTVEEIAILKLNRSIYFYFLINLLKTWDEVASLKKALELCDKWKLKNNGFFLDSLDYAQDWQSGKTGLLSIRTLDNPNGIHPGFWDSGWYLELSEKKGFEDASFFGAPYWIVPNGPMDNLYSEFVVGTSTLISNVGHYSIEPMKVKGYKTPAPVEIEVKPRETVEIELLYVKE